MEITSPLGEITCHMGMGNTVTYLRNNQVVSWLEIEPATESRKSNVLTIAWINNDKTYVFAKFGKYASSVSSKFFSQPKLRSEN